MGNIMTIELSGSPMNDDSTSKSVTMSFASAEAYNINLGTSMVGMKMGMDLIKNDNIETKQEHIKKLKELIDQNNNLILELLTLLKD